MVHDEEVLMISGIWDSVVFCSVLVYPILFHSDSILRARRHLWVRGCIGPKTVVLHPTFILASSGDSKKPNF